MFSTPQACRPLPLPCHGFWTSSESNNIPPLLNKYCQEHRSGGQTRCRESLSKKFPHEPLNEPHVDSLLTPYISLPRCGWVTFPIPPLMSWKTWSTICNHCWSKRRRSLMQAPADCDLYKIVLILPTFLLLSLTSVSIASRKCTLADVDELHKFRHKNVKRLRTQLC